MFVLVTGATGFIGQHLTRRLLALGHRVRILARDPIRVPPEWSTHVDIIAGDVLDAEAVARAAKGVSVVYHLAGEVRDERLFSSVNIKGTEIVLTASAEAGVQTLCYFSSAGVYGTPRPGPVTEDTQCDPLTEYQKAKYMGEHLVRGFSDAGKFRTIVVRPTTVYGEGEIQSSAFFFKWLTAIRDGRFLFLGDKAVANVVYVGDLVEACLFLVEHASKPHEVCVVSDPVSMSEFVGFAADSLHVAHPRRSVPVWLAYAVAAIFQKINQIFETSLPVTSTGVKALSSESIFVPKRLQEDYRFSFPFGFQRGLEQTVQWYRSVGRL
ncbi:MAG: NAD-dependent epimerase/dehydratase family protein [Nitrospiraceae bacterium]